MRSTQPLDTHNMKKLPYYLLVVVSLLFSCKESKKTITKTTTHQNQIEDLLQFFNENAYQETQGTYYSDIDNEGNVVSDKVFNVALSRLIYGLSYSKHIDISNLEKAQKAAAFQMGNLVIEDSSMIYFASCYVMYDYKKLKVLFRNRKNISFF